MKPFTETTPAEREGLTVAQAMERYTQPDWCGYPDALEGVMGCWSLISTPKKICPAFCKDCDCFIKNPE